MPCGGDAAWHLLVQERLLLSHLSPRDFLTLLGTSTVFWAGAAGLDADEWAAAMQRLAPLDTVSYLSLAVVHRRDTVVRHIVRAICASARLADAVVRECPTIALCAARLGNVAALAELARVKNGQLVRVVTWTLDNCLHSAIMSRQTESARFLLQCTGTELVYQRNCRGADAILLAIRYGCLSVLDMIYDIHGPSAFERNTGLGMSYLHYAVREDNLEAIKNLVRYCGADAMCAFDRNGWNCLHVAAYSASIDTVRAMVALAPREALAKRSHNGQTCYEIAWAFSSTDVFHELSSAYMLAFIE